MLETAHLSVKKPHGSERGPKARSKLLNGLGPAVITEIRGFHYVIYQKITECLTEDGVTKLKILQRQHPSKH